MGKGLIDIVIIILLIARPGKYIVFDDRSYRMCSLQVIRNIFNMLEVALNRQLPAYIGQGTVTERQSPAQSLTSKNSLLDTSPSVTA